MKNQHLPSIFGPRVWQTLHVAATYYANNPSRAAQQEMMYFIIGIPAMIPCYACRSSIRFWIAENKHLLAIACQNRDNLFEYFVTMHNFVNVKLNRAPFSVERAKHLYSFDKIHVQDID